MSFCFAYEGGYINFEESNSENQINEYWMEVTVQKDWDVFYKISIT